MVAVVPQDHDSHANPAPMRTGRAAWLILAVDGPAIEVPDRVPSTVVRVIADPRRFRDVLLAERPRIVLCAQPPADAEALEARRRGAPPAHRHASRSTSRRRTPSRSGSPRSRRASTTRWRPPPTPRSSPAGSPGSRRKARARPGSPIVLPIGDGLELDLAAHELRRDGQVVHLRPKEFGLLALLAAHPGRAYTRRELLHLVWGPSPRGRAADGRRPRPLAALEDRAQPDRPACLMTVRGVGYRLDDRPR